MWPVQLAPPCAGEGSLHFRVLERVPLAHVTEQGVHGSHKFHCPLTVIVACFIKFCRFVLTELIIMNNFPSTRLLLLFRKYLS